MKKVLVALTAVAVMSVAVSAMGATSIVNSRHNLGSGNNAMNGAFTGATTQVCVYCHTPHNALEKRALWNRQAPTSNFVNYTSGINKAATSWYAGGSALWRMKAGSPSLMCMSCHDGVTTMNALHRPPVDASASTAVMVNIAPRQSLLGTDLTNDHPVSMVYQTAVTNAVDNNGGATLRAANPGTLYVQNGFKRLQLSKSTGDGDTIECSSCHNVHDDTYRPFLRVSNDNSALCLVCHIK
jgi:predicted CXXCH cytochrome family protein